MPFVLKQIEIGPMQNFLYLIGDEKTKQALVIDPAWDPDSILATAEENGFTIAGLAATHAHYDHTNAIEALLKKIDVPVYANTEEKAYAASGAGIVASLGRTLKTVRSEETVMIGETSVRFLHTPGHTPGSQCVQVGDYLVTGDTLFIGGCGRTDLPGGNPGDLVRSLNKLASLPPHLVLCPGHDYGRLKERPLGDEIKENPYLQTT